MLMVELLAVSIVVWRAEQSRAVVGGSHDWAETGEEEGGRLPEEIWVCTLYFVLLPPRGQVWPLVPCGTRFVCSVPRTNP